MSLKQIIFGLLYPWLELQAWILDLIAGKKPQGNPENSLIIVKLDALGDYVLFRNYLEILRKSKKFVDCKIIFIGNIKNKFLAEEIDSKFVDEFIWIDYPKVFNKTLLLSRYNRALTKTMRSLSCKYLIQPTNSRLYLIDRLLVKNINSKCKITLKGDDANSISYVKKITDRYYDQLIPASPRLVFEFYLNKYFIERVIGAKLEITAPYIPIDKSPEIISKKEYAVLFPGAGHPSRQWPAKYFAEVSDYLAQKYGLVSLIAGGKTDTPIAREIVEFCKGNKPIDITGQTSIPQLAGVLAKAKLLLSNDTSAVHIAACVGTETIFFLKGNNPFGRFGPYPPEFKNMHSLYPIKINESPGNYQKLIEKYKKFPEMKISNISPARVIELVDRIL